MALFSEAVLVPQPIIATERPDRFSTGDRQEFIALVVAGGEVEKAFLASNVQKARCLVFLRLSERLVGIAALKNPRSTYRARIAGSAGANLAIDEFPFELGYVFVLPAARGNGYSRLLTEAALSASDRRGVFATSRTDNQQMHVSLRQHGFSEAGKPYAGRNPQQLFRLFLRPPVPSSG